MLLPHSAEQFLMYRIGFLTIAASLADFKNYEHFKLPRQPQVS